MASEEINFMQRAIQLAKKGLGSTAPNPVVGAVLVHDNRIIGEGYHKKRGEAHAEVNCIADVKAQDQQFISKSTLYVTLEPCSHFGKTPPCANLIVEKRIPKVVIGSTDPNPKVAGQGIRILKDAGIEVVLGIEKKTCAQLNKRFFTYFREKRPYIILKWAQSADGFMAPSEARPVKISDGFTNRIVHRWRSEEQAILIGANTARIDNPLLTTRLWTGKSPLRIVLAPHQDLPDDLHLLNDGHKTLVYTLEKEGRKENVEWIRIHNQDSFPNAVLADLFQRKILSVLVEGGAQTHDSFIKAALWDEARVITGSGSLEKGIEAPLLHLSPWKKKTLFKDSVSFYKRVPDPQN